MKIWVYYKEGIVKIPISEKKFHFGESATTDEGWSSQWKSYWREGDTIYCESMSDGVDCDGRLQQFWKGSWKIGGPVVQMIQGWNDLGDPIFAREFGPFFETIDSSQRDYFAESMGY